MVNGKFTVIDAHCHIYPEKIAARAVNGTDTFYGLSSYGEGTVQHLLKIGEETGIDGYLVQSVATTPKQVSSINRFIASEVDLYRGKMVGLGTLHPRSADILGDIEEIEALGLHGVKLHPDIQDFKADDEACAEIYALCEKKGLPILMHAGDHRYDNSNPNRLAPVLASYKALCMIGAHLGGWSVWEDAKEALAGIPNLFVDTSSSFAFLDFLALFGFLAAAASSSLAKASCLASSSASSSSCRLGASRSITVSCSISSIEKEDCSSV